MSQGERERVLILSDAGKGRLLFTDGNEAAPAISYAVEIWRSHEKTGDHAPEVVRDEGSGGLTVADRNLAAYNEQDYLLELQDGRCIPICITWKEGGITHSFVSTGAISEARSLEGNAEE